MPPDVKTSVIDPSGTPRDVNDSELAAALQQGWRLPEDNEAERLSTGSAREANYGGLSGAVEAGFAGGFRGLTLGGSDVLTRLVGGRGAAQDLLDLKAQQPIPSIGAELVGNVVPALVSGGSSLAKTPAGLLAGVGREIVEEGVSKGVAGRALATAAGAAVEGAGQSGGSYIAQTALEDKPLSAEGFVGALGHGALWAAPVGGALSLGESAFVRARNLFPKKQVSAVAAQGIKQEATSALANAATDGESMARAARQKLDLIDAKIGMADLGEQQTRRVFGAADPQAVADQALGSVEQANLREALTKYEASKAQLDDWIRTEADPDLEAALRGVVAPEVGTPGGRIVPEVTKPAPNQDLLDALDMRGRQLDVTAVGRKKVPADLVEGVGLSAYLSETDKLTSTLENQLADAGIPPNVTTGTVAGRKRPAGLEDLLAGTKEQLDSGKSLREISDASDLRKAYVAGKELDSGLPLTKQTSDSIAAESDRLERELAASNPEMAEDIQRLKKRAERENLKSKDCADGMCDTMEPEFSIPNKLSTHRFNLATKEGQAEVQRLYHMTDEDLASMVKENARRSKEWGIPDRDMFHQVSVTKDGIVVDWTANQFRDLPIPYVFMLEPSQAAVGAAAAPDLLTAPVEKLSLKQLNELRESISDKLAEMNSSSPGFQEYVDKSAQIKPLIWAIEGGRKPSLPDWNPSVPEVQRVAKIPLPDAVDGSIREMKLYRQAMRDADLTKAGRHLDAAKEFAKEVEIGAEPSTLKKKGTPEFEAYIRPQNADAIEISRKTPKLKREQLAVKAAEYDSLADKFSGALDQDHHSALLHYSDGTDGVINRALRAGKGEFDPNANLFRETRDLEKYAGLEKNRKFVHYDGVQVDTAGFEDRTIGDEIRRIDEAIQRSVLDRDAVVYRTINDPESKITGALKPGETFVEHGYASTSANPNLMDDFTPQVGRDVPIRAADRVDFHISLPKGSKAAPIANEAAGYKGGEEEFLLPRGTRFRITKVEPSTATSPKRVFMEAINDQMIVDGKPLQISASAEKVGTGQRTTVAINRTLSDGEVVPVGTAEFTHRGDKLYPESVNVDPAWQRKGIGTRMYKEAERTTGKKIIPSENQTAQGAEFSAKYRGVRPVPSDKEFSSDVLTKSIKQSGIPTHEEIAAHPDREIISTVPARRLKERGWYESPGQGKDAVKADKGRRAISEGQRDPIQAHITPEGDIVISDGRNRLNAAVEADAPVLVKWTEGYSGHAPDDVFKGGSDLESQLLGTKAQLDAGTPFRNIRPGDAVGENIMRSQLGEAEFERALQRRAGKDKDIGPSVARAAEVIGNHEAALAQLTEALGSEAPVTAVANAKAYRAALAAQQDTFAASTAKAATGIDSKVAPKLALDQTLVEDSLQRALRKDAMRTPPAGPPVRTVFGGETVVDDQISKALRAEDMKAGRLKPVAPAMAPAQAVAAAEPVAAGSKGILSKVADVGTALEVLQAMGVHVPDVGSIPVIGPVLSLYLKARAVLGILGRKGGSIGRGTESIIAAKSAGLRNRIASATDAALDVSARGAKKAATFSAGPAALLGQKLFPGGPDPKSKDPRVLYDARMDEIARAQMPGAVAQAVAERIPTSDPHLQDAITTQIERGIQFIASKAPKQSGIAGMIPGDGTWKPSRTALEVWGRYVHAVNDPGSVLEDLSRGHLSIEGAETLRTVYPKLFAEAQRMLLEAAPKMQKTLPYNRRIAISIMYQVPVDSSMAPGHLQFLQMGTPTASPQGAGGQPVPQAGPAITAPLQIGPQTMTALDRRAGM